MYEELIGVKAYCKYEDTEYHGEVIGVGQSKYGWLCELDVPLMGVIYVRPVHLQLTKEKTNDERIHLTE